MKKTMPDDPNRPADDRTREGKAPREIERRYFALLANLPGMAYRCRNEPDWPVEVVSDGCLELTGYPPEAFTGEDPTPFAELIHPADRDRVWARVQAAVASGRPFVLEYRIHDAAGAERWVLEKGGVAGDPVAGVEALEGFITDITDCKHAEDDIEALNERLHRLARVVRDLSGTRSLDSVTEIVRSAARDLADADGATFVLRDGDQCHYVDEDAIAPLWKGKRFPLSACISGWAMLNRRPAVIEDIYEDDRVPHEAYRETFVKSLLMLPIRTEEPVGAIGVYWAESHEATPEDIRILQALADSTSVALENLQVLRELEEGKARIRAIHDHLPIPTLVWERESGAFRLADVNEAARTITHGAIGDLLGTPARKLGTNFPDAAADLERCAAGRGPIRKEVEATLPGRDDVRRLVLTYGYVPEDVVILHAEDVTERRATEEQLRVSQRMDAIGQLAGGVAHDFNNLLTIILGCTELSLESLPGSHPVREDIQEIREAGQRAATLTRQLLAFSSKQILEPEIVCLNTEITGIETMLRRLLGEDIEIAIHLEESLGNVEADPGQIEQVLMNLAVNARDAMPGGGELTITTENVEVDEELAARRLAVPPGPCVLLSVTDTGRGMDTQIRERVFEPFFTTKEKGEGTGLGLATAYGIVKQSGGDIWVDSEPGRGTTFEVYLPRVGRSTCEPPDRPTDDPAPAAVPPGDVLDETLLVVEDEEAVRKLAFRILEGAGYEVLEAADGPEALRLCEEHEGPVDLLITDIVMPTMSGHELAERLTERYPGLEVLFTSGYNDDAKARRGTSDPGAHFLGKPFHPEDLVRKVQEVFEGGAKSRN